MTIEAVRRGSWVRLRLRGEVDVATAGLVHDEVLAALRSETVRHVQLDLANLTFIDSAGMRTLVACHRAVQVSGGTLTVISIPPSVRRQLFAAGLLGLLAGTSGVATLPEPAASQTDSQDACAAAEVSRAR
ncbi:STAS domain-containing protein [Micromonospora sp. ATA32]|nr:STAS domain-containing protein [Micromonospora sp. ATA32]